LLAATSSLHAVDACLDGVIGSADHRAMMIAHGFDNAEIDLVTP
jgi:hypothetical protein